MALEEASPVARPDGRFRRARAHWAATGVLLAVVLMGLPVALLTWQAG